MRTKVLAGLSLAFSLAGSADVLAAEPAQIFKLTKLAQRLPVGETYLVEKSGAFCIPSGKLVGDGVLTEFSTRDVEPTFRQALAGASASTVGGEPNLFSAESDATEPVYEVGGLIHGMKGEVCSSTVGVSGRLTISVQWQIYSRAERKVIATIDSAGSAEIPRGTAAKQLIPSLVRAAFTQAVISLTRLDEFQALSTKAPKGQTLPDSSKQDRIVLRVGTSGSHTLADESASVVLIKASDGFGSGVLVSEDGYILTDAHVVSLDKTVTLRWSDGLETEGRVIRLHRGVTSP